MIILLNIIHSSSLIYSWVGVKRGKGGMGNYGSFSHSLSNYSALKIFRKVSAFSFETELKIVSNEMQNFVAANEFSGHQSVVGGGRHEISDINCQPYKVLLLGITNPNLNC